MGTEKDIFGKGVTKTGKPSFDAYVESLSREMQTYDEADPYKKDALKDMTDRADSFLRRHAGISYEDFLRQVRPEELTEGRYENMQPLERTRVFERETSLYLSALADVEEKGYDVRDVLEELRDKKNQKLKDKWSLQHIINLFINLFDEKSEDYLVGLLKISEDLGRRVETPNRLLEKLRKLNEKYPLSAKKYGEQNFDLEDRLKLRDEEGRYKSLL